MTATVATKTRTRKPTAAKAPVYKSKSAEALALLKGEDPGFPTPQSISSVEDIMSVRGRRMGYAFIYGVAKRNGLATTAAKRRAVRAITKSPEGIVTVQTATGPIAVSPDGTVTGSGWSISPAGAFSKVRARKARV